LAKNQITRVSSYGLVTFDSKILMCRLSAMVPWIQGKWTLPGGGLEFGEAPEQALIREVREETGLLVRPLGLAGVDSYASENDQQHFHSIRIIYHTEILSGSLQYEQHGSTDLCQWWSLADAWKLPMVNLGRVGLQLLQEKNLQDNQ
jgi:8-oxo-dGTP diphosphatase